MSKELLCTGQHCWHRRVYSYSLALHSPRSASSRWASPGKSLSLLGRPSEPPHWPCLLPALCQLCSWLGPASLPAWQLLKGEEGLTLPGRPQWKAAGYMSCVGVLWVGKGNARDAGRGQAGLPDCRWHPGAGTVERSGECPSPEALHSAPLRFLTCTIEIESPLSAQGCVGTGEGTVHVVSPLATDMRRGATCPQALLTPGTHGFRQGQVLWNGPDLRVRGRGGSEAPGELGPPWRASAERNNSNRWTEVGFMGHLSSRDCDKCFTLCPP